MGSSSAAKKAWATRRKRSGGTSKPKSKTSKSKGKAKSKGKKKKKGGKMPENVKQYFKYLNQGMSKAEARKKAGLPPKSKAKKKAWGPGHPLYDWQQKQKK